MSKIELTRKWWNTVRPKGVKSPELDRSLECVEGAEGEDLVTALATVPGAIAKVAKGLDKAQKDVLKSLEGLRLLVEQESKKAAAQARSGQAAEQDEAAPEDKFFDPTFVGGNMRRALRGPVVFGFALGSKPEECALTVHLRGSPKSLMRLAKTRSGAMKACCGQAQADQEDPRMLVLALDGPPVSGVARMLRKHLKAQGITLFNKIRVTVNGEETETVGGEEEPATEITEEIPVGPEPGVVERTPAQLDWESRRADFETAVGRVEELETANHPKSGALRKLVDGIGNEANAGRFTQACNTLGQLLPKLQVIYDEFQEIQPIAAKSGEPSAGDSGRGEVSSDGAPAKVRKDDAAQKQAEQDYKKLWGSLQPKIDDALLTARQFDSLKRARKDIVKGTSNVAAAVAGKDFVKALKLAKELEPKVDDYLKKAGEENKKYQKKGEDISKQLDAATDAKRGDVAKTAANALSGDEIKHLPTAVRNRLLEEMQKSGWTDDKKAAAKKLYSVKYLDPEFEKLDKANRQKMIEKMKADPDFKKARDNWKKLTKDERVAIMKKAIDYQAEAYGIPKTTIATYTKADGTNFGYYSHKDGILHINDHDKALKDGGFDEAIDTAVHENAHHYQALLIDDLEAKKIKPGDPLYDQAMTFKLNDTQRGFYVQPPEKKPSANTGDEYFTQPQENHSRILGAAVQKARLGK